MIKFENTHYMKRAYFATRKAASDFRATLDGLGYPYDGNRFIPHAHGYVVAWDSYW